MYFLLFILGVCIGSFLNVVIWRYKPGGSFFSLERLLGRSHCPYCKHTLRWFELFPLVSFIIQGGTCRRCGHKLSWQYPLVELASGVIVAGIPYFLLKFYNAVHLPFDPTLLWIMIALWVLAFLVFLVMTVIDLKHYLIPDQLNIMLGVLGVGVVIMKLLLSPVALPYHSSFLKHFALVFSPINNIVFNHLAGSLVAGLFFLVLVLGSKGRAMGWGDVKLAFAGGLLLGWPDIALALILAFVVGGVIGGIFLALGFKSMKDRLPFAPFIVGSMAVSVLIGYPLLQWYFSVMGL